MKNSEVELVKHAIRFYEKLQYDLNWHIFNIIKSSAYASASVNVDKNKYQ